MKKLKQALSFLISTLVVLGFTLPNASSSPNAASALDEYQRIQKESSSSRLFSYADGAPVNISDTYMDEFGYLWLGSYDPTQYYRFNGTRFQDMFAEFHPVEKDSLIGNYVMQTEQRTIHIAGRHKLYRWNGYRFERFAFPKDDRIEQAQISGDAVLCIGNKGYAVLKDNSWSYIRKSMIDSKQTGKVAILGVNSRELNTM